VKADGNVNCFSEKIRQEHTLISSYESIVSQKKRFAFHKGVTGNPSARRNKKQVIATSLLTTRHFTD
jgi:hypothetical protein